MEAYVWFWEHEGARGGEECEALPVHGLALLGGASCCNLCCGGEKGLLELPFVVQEQRYDPGGRGKEQSICF